MEMNFNYKFARYPKNKQLLIDINLAANRLYYKIKNLDLEKLQLSESMKKYFSHKVYDSLNTNLIKYSYHLAWALNSTDILLKDFVLIDHGGGSGMFGLLAVEFGIGTVIYNDISKEWTNDAHVIGKALGNESNHYVPGDIDDLISFVNKHNILSNAIVSYNVIEHIYDMNSFLIKLKYLNKSGLTVFMSTGANKYNRFKTKFIINLQRKIEYGDKDDISSINNCYSKIREKIIKNLSNKLTTYEIKKLTEYTRGMIEEDINNSVFKYLKTGDYPDKPEHPTNTCDPYTGYWAEHFMNPFKLKKVLSNSGFTTSIHTGYWGKPNQKIKRLVSNGLNITLSVFGKRGLFISPYWTIYATN